MKKTFSPRSTGAALGLALLLGLPAWVAAVTAPLAGTWRISEGGQARQFEVARDQIYVLTADQRYLLRKIAPQPNAGGVRTYVEALAVAPGEQAGLVLYPQGVAQTNWSRLYLTRQVLVRLAPGVATNGLAAADVAQIEAVSYAPGYYLVTVTSPAGSLTFAETLRQKPGVLYAEAQLARQRQPHWIPNDTLFTNQWHLLNTGQNGAVPGIDINVTNVWDTYHGNGIVIGILDSGTQTNHPDLMTNVVPGLSHNWLGGDPGDPTPDMTVADDAHGTAVAGVAAARGNNGLGVSGVAPEAGIVAERLIGGPVSDAQFAQAILWQNNVVSVKNNSYGMNTTYFNAPMNPLEEAAFEQSVTAGRNGRGVVFVFSAGNGRQQFDNANYAGEQNSIYTLTVGAISDQGVYDNYSTPGACLLIAAPSGGDWLPSGAQAQATTTTDFTDTNGFNIVLAAQSGVTDYPDTDYTKMMNGTSSSAPVVSGAVALILEANPNLGYRDVQEIIAKSARVIDQNGTAWVTNAAGFHFSDDYGAGMIDVRAAVALARTWENLGPMTNVTAELTNLALAIPDNRFRGVSTNIFISQDVRVEHAVLTVDITHPMRGDLEIVLTAPSGVQSVMATTRPYDPFADMSGWTFMTTHDWGESSFGPWTVTVRDRYTGSVGTINSLKLTVYGSGGGTPSKSADPAIAMSANPDPVQTGSNLTYTITVVNKGLFTASNVVVTQLLPPGTLYSSSAASQGNASLLGSAVTWNVGELFGKTLATLTVNVTVYSAGTNTSGTIYCAASLTSTTPDADPSNNDFFLSTRVRPPMADLAVTLTASPSPVVVGAPLSYLATVVNRGPSPAGGVRVTNTLPAGVVFNSAAPSQGNVLSAFNNVVVSSLGSLTNGQSATVTIVATPTQTGNLVASARVVGNQADPVPGNNFAALVTSVSPAADLALTMSLSTNALVTNYAIVTGSNFTFWVTVTNRGPSVAPAVVVSQNLPASATLLASNTSVGNLTLVGNTLTANLGTLFAGASATYSGTLRSAATLTNVTLTTTATASSAQADPDQSNNGATVGVTVRPPFVSFAAAASRLLVDPNGNGALDPGETVTVALWLRNAGNVPNTNLVATLLAANGVVNPSAPQPYGVVPPGESRAGSFTFQAAGTSNGVVVANLQLRDNGAYLTNVSFTFKQSVTTSRSNTVAITIPDHGTATPPNYPSVLNVTGVTGTVGNVSVTLSNLAHSYPHDLSLVLVGPAGQNVALMAHVSSGNFPLTNVNLTIDQQATIPLPAADQIYSGSYQPASYGLTTNLPAPAPTNLPYGTSLSVFNGKNPNGDWKLYVWDDLVGDYGQIANGWSLQITTITPVNQLADLALAASVSTNAVLVGDSLTYTFTVVNNGPDKASNVILTNTLPASLQLLSTTFSQGTQIAGGNGVNLGSLATGASATVTLVAKVWPPPGAIVVAAGVQTIETDPNPANNTASAGVTATLPVADPQVGVAAWTWVTNFIGGSNLAETVLVTNAIVGSNLTYTVTVTNLGLQNALKVYVTNALPASASFVSATPSNACTRVGANVLCDAGDLAPGNGAQFLIVVAPTNTASLTNSVQVITFSTDTNTVRKTASFVITNVAWPAPILVNAGAELLWEELSPPDGVVDPGEQVTVALKLENRGQIPTTTNLWATLLATDDVTLPGPSQRCGALSPFGPAAALAFTFTATQFPTNPFPTNIVAVLQLVDSSMGFTNYVPFSLNTPVSGNPASAQVIKIPDHGTAAPYPSALTVSGLSRLVKNVTVTVSNLTHGFPSDVNILVVSPSGQTVQLLGGAGAGYAVTNVALTFDDNAPAPAPKNSQLATTSYQPGSYSFVPFPFPGPVQPYGQKLAAFNGTDPNGPWRLYVFDSSPGDAGTIGGWSLNLTTVTPFTLAAANLRVTATNEPAPAVAGMPFSYSVTVLNGGPDQADNVLLTNTLPGNSRFVSANPSQGTCTNSGTELICSLGSLAANAVATVNVVVTPLASPSLTFGAAVGSPATDLYLTDNQVTLVTAVIIPLNPVLSGSYDGASQTFLLTLTGDAFTSYALQSSTDLVHWGFLTSGTTDASGWLQVADSRAAPQGHQFYRAVRQ